MEFFPADGNRKDAFREKLKAFFNL
jgi:hypothetical protein